MHDLSRQDVEDYFAWLDGLRASGTTNMFGARPLLATEFCLDRKISSAVHAAWMETYDPSVTRADRVEQAMKS